jgi:transcriptional regulator with XRE-family HTH domain
MRTNAQHLARFIRTKRIELGMSQCDLTKKLGWQSRTTQYISNIELSKCPFPPKSVKLLSDALNTSIDSIVYEMVKDYNLSLNNEVRPTTNP